jgi:ubiquinone/menaquinone biosynthesis C-methylase UbiE
MINYAGNTYDKFGAKNPLVRWMMDGFKNSLYDFVSDLDFNRVLEVGCGEGHILELLNLPHSLGMDIDWPILVEARTRFPAGHFAAADGAHLPLPDKHYDLALGIEILEHVPNPAAVLVEIKRVTREYCILSVPREPIWRILNMARGHYLGAWGNTPGHIQHWSSGAFVQLVSRYMQVVAVKQPFPWTMILCKP